jgi:hypothetical protein
VNTTYSPPGGRHGGFDKLPEVCKISYFQIPGYDAEAALVHIGNQVDDRFA